MNAEYIPVDSTDELTVAGGRRADRVRMLGEYRVTNAPLSRFEIERREKLRGGTQAGAWVPRTLDNIGDLVPVPEQELDTSLLHA